MLKKISVIVALFLAIFAFNACDTTVTPTPEKPEAIGSLQATSIDSASVGLKITASASQGNALFDGYYLKITPGTFPEEKIPNEKLANYKVQGLTEGTIYTFTVYTKYTNGEVSPETSVQWSPATRYTADIRVYEYASSRGSGLNLQDVSGEPTTLTINHASQWDLCLDTRNGVLDFGSPKDSKYVDALYKFSNGQMARDLDVYNVFEDNNNLDELFDTKAIDGYTASQMVYNFIDKTTGFIMAVKTYPGTGSSYFAKILVKANNGVILQGTAPDRYVQLSISYQKVAGVPYAVFGTSTSSAPIVKSHNSNK